jgi:DNA-directed RNA polymerase subunit M/transcription elongation factor TFIIS
MKFCPVCSNYLFLQDLGDDGLKHLCRHCGFNEPVNSSEDALILETIYNKSLKRQTESQINAFTRLDPTLPHIKTIPCPNGECPSNTDPSIRDILYMKSDSKTLTFQYLCTVCNTQWGS